MTDFKDGDLVRLKGDTRVIELDSVNPDPNYDPKEETYADAHYVNGYRSVDIDSPDDIELVPEDEIEAIYRLPTLEEIADQVSSSLHSAYDEAISISESGPDGPGVIQAFGRTSSGLGVAFKVTVSEIERYDE